ncbi:3536_t:CDS:1, partial [Acaulospora morrowiae]
MASIFGNSKLFVFFAIIAILLVFNIDSHDSLPHHKRSSTGDATFYEVGLGACGKVNNDNQLVCALNHDQFDPSPGGNPNKNRSCGKKIKATFGKKSVIVTVVDRCADCKKGDIDLS